ncbi:hypothetical protein EW146_g10062, partial [Bondarzewia mesenterica]
NIASEHRLDHCPLRPLHPGTSRPNLTTSHFTPSSSASPHPSTPADSELSLSDTDLLSSSSFPPSRDSPLPSSLLSESIDLSPRPASPPQPSTFTPPLLLNILPDTDIDPPMMTATPATWFHGDGQNGENPGDFIEQVEQGFTEKTTDAHKIEKVGQFFKSGSAAESWYDTDLFMTATTTWKDFKVANFKKWPKLKPVVKTHVEKIITLQAHRLTEAEVTKKVENDGVEEWAYVCWVNRAQVLASAVPDSDGMLIEGVRKDLPQSVASLVTGSYATWTDFCDAVRQIHPNDLTCAQESDARLAAVERELYCPPPPRSSSPTTTIQCMMECTSLSAPHPPFNANPFSTQATIQMANPFQGMIPQPATQRGRLSNAEHQAIARRNQIPHHPNTTEGIALYEHQITTWHAANPNGRLDEHWPYPLTPGTAPLTMGECWKCGTTGHHGDECTGHAIPEGEYRWHMIANTINRAPHPAAPIPIQYIYTPPEYYYSADNGWHTRDREGWRSEAQDEQGKEDGPAA